MEGARRPRAECLCGGSRWTSETGEHTTFDGKVCRMFSPSGLEDYPIGTIRKEDYFIHFAVMHNRPILMAYRATHPKMSPYHGGPFKLTGTRIRA